VIQVEFDKPKHEFTFKKGVEVVEGELVDA
jgi:hypothetical protein